MSLQLKLNAMLKAIKMCLLEDASIRSSALINEVDKTSLMRYINKCKANFDDISAVNDEILLEFIRRSGKKTPSNMVFSVDQEKDLVDYSKKCMNHYYGLSITELLQLAYQMAKKLNLTYPCSWDEELKAGRMWYRLFMKRHPELTLRTTEQTSMNRVKAFCKTNVDKFYEKLAKLLDKYKFNSTTIYNMDESGFSTVPTKTGGVIAIKDMRRNGKVAERDTMITLVLTVIASGNSIPPMFLFPRKNVPSSFLDNVSSGAIGIVNSSGLMNREEFVHYIRHFIKYVKPSIDSPVLLIIDNHTSHLSVEALDIATVNGVHVLSFPPHCSHKLQPLYVSVLGPLKAYYRSRCSAWQKNNHNKVLELRHIAGLVCETLDLALTPKTIKSGFVATGIFPYNPDIFTDADFVQAVDINSEAVAIEAELDENTQRRIVLDETNVGRENAVVSSESSTSYPTTSQSESILFSSILDENGSLKDTTPHKTFKRGRKSMESTELTSPLNIKLKVKQLSAKMETAIKSKKATQTKIMKKKAKLTIRNIQSQSSEEDVNC